MSLTNRLRRTTVGLAAATLLVGGSVGFVAAASTAGASSGVSTPQVDSSIPLHNNTAGAGEDCPAGGAAYWHFVFAPNNDSASFTSITLNLGTETLTFSGAAIVPNGGQTDNVFVAVPAGHALTDLVTSGSSATYSGTAPSLFNLSHTCAGTVETTTTTAPETTTTTAPETTTTTAPETTTTTAPETTTTTAPETTTTTAPETTTTTAPETTTTTAPETTTTTAPETTTTTAPETTTTTVEVLGTVQTSVPPTTVAEVLGAVQVNGELPYTGTNTSGMVAAGLAVLLGGALLVGLARTKGRNPGEQ